MIFEPVKDKNSDIEDYEDIPRDKVKREDGLPTIDDLAKIMGQDKKEGDLSGNPTIQLVIKICS